jgi:hypothetical protein
MVLSRNIVEANGALQRLVCTAREKEVGNVDLKWVGTAHMNAR